MENLLIKKTQKSKSPRWSTWKKRPLCQLKEAVALSINVSPNSLPTLKETDPKKHGIYIARLKTALRQPIGLIEVITNHPSNGTDPESMMVSLASFVSFAKNIVSWEKTLPKEFIEIGNVDRVKISGSDVQGGEIPTKLKSAGPDGFRRAPNKFVTAMIKLLVAIAMSAGRKRIPFDVNKMPGMVEDLREVAIEFDSTFGSYGIETFKEYMLPLCNFTRGRKKRNDTDFYKKVLPLYFKNTQVIKLEPQK